MYGQSEELALEQEIKTNENEEEKQLEDELGLEIEEDINAELHTENNSIKLENENGETLWREDL
ncbi:MAG: hypothetical protein FWC68_04165 [Oscillospiraceae bacterium]|nr:hypothetical protein [Oscillospiraceae bacterium]